MHYGAEGYELPIQPTALPPLVSKMVLDLGIAERLYGVDCYRGVGNLLRDLNCF